MTIKANIEFENALELFREVGKVKGCKVLGVLDERGQDSKYEWCAFFRNDDWTDGGTAGLIDGANIDFAGPENPGVSVFEAHKRVLECRR